MSSVSRRGLRFPKVTSAEVKVGVLEGSTYPPETLTDAKTGKKYTDPRAGMPVAAIAAGNEFGTEKNSHARPFFGNTVAAKKKTWADDIVKLLRGGVKVPAALETMGTRMRDDVQDTINKWPADNSPEWAAKKGSSKGLIFTGNLLRSIDYEVKS